MKQFTGIAVVLTILSLVVGCANIGSISGGEKDEDPPVPVKAKPSNYTLNYNSKKVIIEFNEFVELKDAFNEFTISPPLEKKPIPETKGKKISVDLFSSKLDSNTYTLDFGNSVVDYHEGNILKNFQFVISKNVYIDSFAIKGKATDAFSLKPDEEHIFICLYKNLSDTAPKTTTPSYIARTLATGDFKINHIAPGIYNVFALKDANSNMMFDIASEQIGFLSDPIYLLPDSIPEPFIEEPDTTTSDTLAINLENKKRNKKTIPDITETDSLEFMVYGYNVSLFTFKEKEPYRQYLSEYSRENNEAIMLIFNESLDSVIKPELIVPDTTGIWYICESNKTLDTLTYWLADSNLINKDSIMLAIDYPVTDTNNIDRIKTDTILLRKKNSKADQGRTQSKESGNRSGSILNLLGGNNEKAPDTTTIQKVVYRVKYNTNINPSKHDLNVPVQIEFEAPIVDYNPDLIELIKLEDTLEIKERFNFLPDTNNIRKFKLNIAYESNTDYILKIYEGAFSDIYKRTIDSTTIKFKTQRDDYYAIINMNMIGITKPTIVQLLDKDEKVLKSSSINSNKKVVFDFLKPGEYSIKAILDENGNGKWDTGHYEQKLQPEKVYIYPAKIEVRSNREIENQWELTP